MSEPDAGFARRRDRLVLRTYAASASATDAAATSGSATNAAVPASQLSDIDLGDHVAMVAGDTLWVLEAAEASRVNAMSAALAWFVRQPTGLVDRIGLIARHAPSVAARRLANFRISAQVFTMAGDGLSVVEPEPHAPNVVADPRHLALAGTFSEAGADVVVEYGVVSAEVVGLEVARVVEEQGAPLVRIGVGAHDRETFRMVHGDEATVEQLRTVVETVALQRRPDSPTHPLNLLARERALRHRLLEHPAAIGMKTLEIAEPPVQRTNVKDGVPCCAIGRNHDDGVVVVVFASGVDLDVVPFAADARARLASDAHLMIVTESRNIVPLQLRIAELVAAPVEFRGA